MDTIVGGLMFPLGDVPALIVLIFALIIVSIERKP